MEQLAPVIIFLFVLFALLGSGVWVGLALLGVAFVGMELFTSRPPGPDSWRPGIGNRVDGMHEYGGPRRCPEPLRTEITGQGREGGCADHLERPVGQHRGDVGAGIDEAAADLDRLVGRDPPGDA